MADRYLCNFLQFGDAEFSKKFCIFFQKGLAKNTLQKRMQARCQMTFSAYVENSRMKIANQLLRNTDTAIQEIAKAVGYSNINSFYKAYKRLFNESPLDYRTHYNSKN